MLSNEKNLRILMVEDVENDAVVINHELNRGGISFHAKRVETQEEFLRELTNNPPDLILSDHGLPSFNGFDALGLAQERCPDTPFIFVSASANGAEAQTALRCGARAWVPKANLPSLVPVVREALQLTQERRQRQVAEKKIREHAAQLHLWSRELNGQAIFTLDPEGRVTDWNAGAAALFGFEADEIIGRHFGCFYRPDDRTVGKPLLDLKSATTGRRDEEGWRVRRDGTQFWAHATLTAQGPETGTADGFVYLVQDLTEHRRNEETLRECAESYRLLFEQCPDALLVVTEGKIVVANLAAHRLLGRETSEALVGRAFADFACEPDRADLNAWLARLAVREKSAAAVPVVTERFLRRANGCAAFARIAAARLTVRDEPAVLLAIHDATGEELEHDLRAQSLAAETLHASEVRLAAILAASPDAIITTDLDARVIEWNDTAEEIFGRTRAAVVGHPVGEVLGSAALSAEDLAELARHFDPASARNTRRVDQIVVRRATGEAFVADLFIRECPPTAPKFYTLFLREQTGGNDDEDVNPPPARNTASPLVPLCDPTKIFIDEPRTNGSADRPRPNGANHKNASGSRPPGGQRGPLDRAQQATQATAEARRSIGAIISHTRTPWGDRGLLSRSEVEELERVLRLLEIRLDEREVALAAAETKLTNQSRDLSEAEALLKARQELLTAMQDQAAAAEASSSTLFSTEEIEALRKLKQELERQANSLTEARNELKTREEFIERSEAALMDKIQAQQEREIQLDQREENQRSDRPRACAPETAAVHEPEPCAVA